MKEFVIQKQFIPARYSNTDPLWARRQVWVYRLNGDDIVDEFDTLEEAQIRRSELRAADPTNRVYRIAQQVSGSASYQPVE